ncbi:exopolygalacturonase-like [Cucurbita pepo subsp. pepo]|uniref:exopolygalacturonase-like n=1 Tax=Cucurbita pepo subsp. pepo TaxID=3664 RepID=UPI000C9DA56B|nr:exopolygalacturonase-like [Cucurbita pepo subsp. pepo]
MGLKKCGVLPSSWVVFFLFLFSITEGVRVGRPKVFNVVGYGAIPDGTTDNSKAFLEAWKDACEWKGRGRVYVPKGTFKLKSVLFLGPCEGQMAFVIKGILKAPTDMSFLASDSWINFRYVDQLSVSGGGSLDGEGSVAWPRNECKKNPNCQSLPTTMRFDFITNSKVHHVHSMNSKNNHFLLFGCSKMNITKIRISAPSDSPNTDGIKIGNSDNIDITNSIIGTGDDCISILSGSNDIYVSNVVCGPGHGISIGSLGKYDKEDVSGITVRNCTFKDTTDGVRIKTWATSANVNAYNIHYEDIFMNEVGNPIIIDQQYCPVPPCDQRTSSGVQISNVTFKNIWGSSKSASAVTLRCSKTRPCKDIVLEDIYLKSSPKVGQIFSSCSNVYGFSYGYQSPRPCL